jgi:hypothetical protein
VYYEGNLYRSENLLRFADRAKHAAGRCRWRRFDPERWTREHPNSPPPRTEHGLIAYPTTAETLAPASELIEVAPYDDELGFVHPRGPEQAMLLRAWICPVEDEVADLMATGVEFDRRRATRRDRGT